MQVAARKRPQYRRGLGSPLAIPWLAFETRETPRPILEDMQTTFLAGLLIAGASAGNAAEPSRFHLFGAAGLSRGSAEAIHLAAGPGYSLNDHFSLGADFAYSYHPLARQARGGGNRAYWGLLTLTAAARPSGKVSPYVVLSYGLGRYVDSRGEADIGKAGSLGAGLSVRLRPRVSLFVESRLALIARVAPARDGFHAELPVRISVRFGL